MFVMHSMLRRYIIEYGRRFLSFKKLIVSEGGTTISCNALTFDFLGSSIAFPALPPAGREMEFKGTLVKL